MSSRKPSRPKSIKILGKRVKIVYSPTKIDDTDFGLFEQEKLTVTIFDDENWQSHLLHELIHAIFFIAGYDHVLEEKLEEALVRALEHGLVTLVKFG